MVLRAVVLRLWEPQVSRPDPAAGWVAGGGGGAGGCAAMIGASFVTTLILIAFGLYFLAVATRRIRWRDDGFHVVFLFIFAALLILLVVLANS